MSVIPEQPGPALKTAAIARVLRKNAAFHQRAPSRHELIGLAESSSDCIITAQMYVQVKTIKLALEVTSKTTLTSSEEDTRH